VTIRKVLAAAARDVRVSNPIKSSASVWTRPQHALPVDANGQPLAFQGASRETSGDGLVVEGSHRCDRSG